MSINLLCKPFPSKKWWSNITKIFQKNLFIFSSLRPVPGLFPPVFLAAGLSVQCFLSLHEAAKSTEMEQSSQGFWLTKDEGQPDLWEDCLPPQQIHVQLRHSWSCSWITCLNIWPALLIGNQHLANNRDTYTTCSRHQDSESAWEAALAAIQTGKEIWLFCFYNNLRW